MGEYPFGKGVGVHPVAAPAMALRQAGARCTLLGRGRQGSASVSGLQSGSHSLARRQSAEPGDGKGAGPANGVTIGCRSESWAIAEVLRGLRDAVDCKHVVLCLIFLTYICDACGECHPAVLDQWGQDCDEYIAENVFWVPTEASRPHPRAQARQPAVGLIADQAMTVIGRDNRALKDVLAQDYGRPALDRWQLGQLIDLVSNTWVGCGVRSRDVLSRVHEYSHSQFASAEGKGARLDAAIEKNVKWLAFRDGGCHVK